MTKLEDLKYFLYDLKLLLPKTLHTHTMIGTLEQKLDRLEKLEKENQELSEMYDFSIKEGHRLLKAKQKFEYRLEQLEKEYQNLKEVMKNREEVAIELIKAITILKDRRHILKYNGIDGALELGWLTQEEYNLLKQVFESVGGNDET